MRVKSTSAPRQSLYGLSINTLDRASLFSLVDARMAEGLVTSINFLNAHCFNVAQKDKRYRAALENCTVLLNDGVGVDIAGKLAGVSFPENMNGTDLIPEFFSYARDHGLAVYCMGSTDEVIERAARIFERDYPDLTLAGYSNGFFDNSDEVVTRINASGADMLVLGMGVPLQEIWTDEHLAQLYSVRLCICGGAIFDFVSGNVMRAPPLVRRLKMEWLFRLAQEPRRLFSRYVLGSFVFLYNIIARRKT